MGWFQALLPLILKVAGSTISAVAQPNPQQPLVGFERQDVEVARGEAQNAAREQMAAAREFASRDVTIPGFDVNPIVGDINVPGLSPGLGLGISQGTADIIGQGQSLPGIRFPEGGMGGTGVEGGAGGGRGGRGGGDVDRGQVTFNQFPNDPRPPSMVRDIMNTPLERDQRGFPRNLSGRGEDSDLQKGDRGIRGGMDPEIPGGDRANEDLLGDPRTHPDDRRGSTSASVSFANASDIEQGLDDIARLLATIEGVGAV